MSEKEKLIAKEGKLILLKDGREEIIGNLIIPTEIRTNIDTKTKMVYLAFNSEGKRVVQKLPRDKIDRNGIKGLTKYGADSWDNVVDYYVKFVRSMMKKKSVKKTFEHSKIGLGEYENERVIKLYEGIGIDSKYSGDKYNIEPKGSYEEWLNMVKTQVLGKKYLELALVVGFTPMVLNVLSEEDSLVSMIVNFCGSSSTGKTLATKLALSAWGYPDMMDNGLLSSWFGTDQGILSSLVDNFGIPIGIDDTSLQSREKDYTNIIYQIVNGQTKLALNIDGSNRARGYWKTVVISSSEESILENTDVNKKGVGVRILEVKAEQITESAENAEEIEKVVMKNYGHAGVEFSKTLVKISTLKISEMLEGYKVKLMDAIDGDSMTNRVAKKLAIIILTARLMRICLGIEIDMNALAATLIDIEEKNVEKRDLGEKAYEHLMEYFQTNMSKFFKDGSNPSHKKEVLGKYLNDVDDKVCEIRVPVNNFKTIMKKLGFNDELVIKAWKNKGLLNHDKEKNTLLRVFRPETKRMQMYAIKVISLEKEPLNLEYSEE